MKTLLLTVTNLVLIFGALAQTVIISKSGGWFETAYVEWNAVTNADSYNVYYSGGGFTNVKIDDPLIRSYGTYFRADVPGLAAGNYTIKVAPVISGSEGTATTSESINVIAHDRSGFAFANGRIPGAYKANGTPKDGAVIIYVTEKTVNTVSLDVTGATNPCVGIENILLGFKKGKDNRPLIIRMVGQVHTPTVNDKGDIIIENSNNASSYITFEGIGDDATADGWGIRVKNASNVEIRNVGTMNCNSDEGDNIGLQQNNDYIWVHNCDFFYGDAGSAADQVKGDGALDCKKSTYITFSYNHFWDSGKCNLLGLSEGTTVGYYITYHHNWYDHSDSRHPRVRYYSAHVYNNYYDGNAKYGIGSTLGSSVFSEGNYFRNCKYPMLTSMQGSDVWDEAAQANNYNTMPTFSNENGGTIKAYNNYMEGQKRFIPYNDPNTTNPNSNIDFDAYVVTSRNTTVPSSVVSAYGSNTYNNFDTDASLMYSYTAQTPANAKTSVMDYAGRINGGDFTWTFNNSVDDDSYAVNTGLKSALINYATKLVFIQGEGNPLNQAPITTITSPIAAAKYLLGTIIGFTATATDADGTVSSVVFYAQLESASNAIIISTDNSQPYTANWNPTVAGTYKVYTLATDDKGKSGLSDQSYTIIIDDPNQNDAPTVSVSSDKSNYAENTDVIIIALAIDDNAVAKVEFFNGSILLKTVTVSPYIYTMPSVAVGNYEITAVATDNEGLYSSASCTFSVVKITISDLIHNFTESGIASSFFTIVGNLSSSKGTVDYAGQTLTQCLKMESSTQITFTIAQEAVLDLVFNSDFIGTIKINNVSYTANAGIVSVTLPADNYTILKGLSANLFYMSITYSNTPTELTQNITLNAGWNLISINVHPTDSTIETLFSGLDLVMIKDAEGFWKAGQIDVFNTLHTIKAGKGYLVYMNTAGTLMMVGGQCKSLLQYAPTEQWQLIGCPFQSPIPFPNYFNTANCEMIKNFDGFGMPNGTTNSINNIEPSKAYFIK